MKKITTIDKLTFYVNGLTYMVEINEDDTTAKSIEDLEDLEQIHPSYAELDSVGRSDGKFHLNYELPEGYQPFTNAKKYPLISKLQLIQRLLAFDPLADGSRTFLDLNNVFFKGFKDIKVLYRSNGHLPYHRATALEQYKLFALGLISERFTYKKYVLNKELLLKKEDEHLLYLINATQSVSELKVLINDVLVEEQAMHHEAIKREIDRRQSKNRLAWVLRGALTIFIVSSFFFVMNKIDSSISEAYKTELYELNLENEILLAASSGNVEKASKLMEERGDSTKEIARLYLDTGMYNEAIEYDQTIEEEVVERLYDLDQKEKILTLDSDSEFIAIEKDIVEYNTEVLDHQISLIENKNTLKRLAMAYIEHEDYSMLENVQEFLDDPEIADYIERSNLMAEISSLNQQIYDLTENTEDDTEDKENKIKTLNEELVQLQRELLLIEEKLGIDK